MIADTHPLRHDAFAAAFDAVTPCRCCYASHAAAYAFIDAMRRRQAATPMLSLLITRCFSMIRRCRFSRATL